MSLSDPLNHIGSIWYHSEPLEVPHSPNQFLGWDFFAISYSKPALVNTQCPNCNVRKGNSVFFLHFFVSLHLNE